MKYSRDVRCRSSWYLKTTIKSHRGSSVLEVTIAAGIMGILVMAFTNMASQSNKTTAMLEEKINILEFQKDLISFTATKNLCEKVFTDTPATFTLPVATFPPATPIVVNGLYLDPTGTQNFAVTNAVLTKNAKARISRIDIDSIVGTAPNFIANLNIYLNNTLVSRKPITSQIQLTVALSGSDYVLTGCQTRVISGGSIQIDSQAVCESIGGFWTAPGGGRPAFCSFDSDSMSWF